MKKSGKMVAYVLLPQLSSVPDLILTSSPLSLLSVNRFVPVLFTPVPQWMLKFVPFVRGFMQMLYHMFSCSRMGTSNNSAELLADCRSDTITAFACVLRVVWMTCKTFARFLASPTLMVYSTLVLTCPQ